MAASNLKLNVKQTVTAAKASGDFYPINGVWRKLFFFAGGLTCLLIVTIPLGIWIIMVARGGGLGISDEGFAFKGLGSAGWRWEAIEAFEPQRRANFYVAGGGLLGAAVGAAASAAVAKKTPGLKGPIRFKVKGSRGWKIIPAHTYERSVEMARKLEAGTGLEILPQAAPAAETV